jgi:hypothetical protein
MAYPVSVVCALNAAELLDGARIDIERLQLPALFLGEYTAKIGHEFGGGEAG